MLNGGACPLSVPWIREMAKISLITAIYCQLRIQVQNIE